MGSGHLYSMFAKRHPSQPHTGTTWSPQTQEWTSTLGCSHTTEYYVAKKINTPAARNERIGYPDSIHIHFLFKSKMKPYCLATQNETRKAKQGSEYDEHQVEKKASSPAKDTWGRLCFMSESGCLFCNSLLSGTFVFYHFFLFYHFCVCVYFPIKTERVAFYLFLALTFLT